jgi:hypothetical protein
MFLPGLQRLLNAAEVPVMAGSGETRRRLSLLRGEQLYSAYLQGEPTQTMQFGAGLEPNNCVFDSQTSVVRDMFLPGLQRLLNAAEVPVMAGSGGTRRRLSLLRGEQLHSAYLQGGYLQTPSMQFGAGLEPNNCVFDSQPSVISSYLPLLDCLETNH